jgi:inosine-uridine nucleoside N-ribohydrolase
MKSRYIVPIVFALGLLINSADLLDTKMVITTSEQPELSAKCVWEHVRLSQLEYDIPVGIGRELPPYEQRASVCGIPGLVGFALEGECSDVDADLIPDGVAAMAEMIMVSDRDDWWYIAIGGQTSLMALIVEYPEAAARIETLIVMGGT